MSSIKVSDYVFFLKACHYGHGLLEKCYKKMQQLHRGLLLDARQQGGICLKALQDLNPLMNDAVLSMVPSYLGWLEEQRLIQETSSQSILMPIWDYALVLNDQQNLHTFLSKRDLEFERLLKIIAHTYRSQAWGRGVLWVEQLKKPQAVAQFINEKIRVTLREIQTSLDKSPIKGEAAGAGAFEVLMQHLKGYQAFTGPHVLKKGAKGDDAGSTFRGGH